MTYKIAHIADTHIRNLKYHDEYKVVFKKMYEKLRQQGVDAIVHCGDLAHTKTQLSPEYFALATEFLYNLSEIAPTYIILGNHDGNLKNSTREDAVTPIVTALNHPNLHLLKDSGEYNFDNSLTFNVKSIFDRDNWVEPTDESRINIGLYHGAVMGSKTGSGWAMEFGDDDISIFSKCDYAMLGDIHKPQILDPEGRVQYAGSTVQQNFGESGKKGYKLWSIKSKDDFSVEHVGILSPRPFITITLTDSGGLPEGAYIPRGCRLRLIAMTNLPSNKIRMVSDYCKSKYNPYSVSFVNKSEDSVIESMRGSSKIENMRDLAVQEKWIKEYLKDYSLEDEVMDEILSLNSKFNMEAERNEQVSRNVIWNVKEMRFDNLFNYGSNNTLDFTKISGIVGIFGKNYSGKSSIIDSLLFGLYNTTSKGERKNVHIINQNKDSACINVSFNAAGQDYKICRNLNKVNKTVRGKKTIDAKGDLDFTNTTINESCNGDSKTNTDANIRKVIGSIDDFMITSMASQLDSLSFIKEGSTKRKEILAKFLDLDLFDKKFKLAKASSSEVAGIIKKMKAKNYSGQLIAKQEELEEIKEDIVKQQDLCARFTSRYDELMTELNAIDEELNSRPTEIIDIKAVKDLIILKNRDLKQASSDIIALKNLMQKNTEIINEIDGYLGTLSQDRLETLESNWSLWTQEKNELVSKLKSKEVKHKSTSKKIHLLEGHEYDPNCKFCCENKFVKDANKAVKELPQIQQDIGELKSSIEELDYKIDNVGIDQIKKDLQKIRELRNRKHKMFSEIEQSKSRIESAEARIELFKNEIASNEAKVLEYEDNRHVIENLSSLLGEQRAVKAKVNEYKEKMNRCNEKIQGYLIEQGSVQQFIKTIEEQKKEQEELEKEWIAYDLFMRCMHPNGIAYEVIKQKLPIINEEIQKCLTNIVDFEVLFENNGKNLDILIKHPQYEARPLSMGSGAEKTIAAMAIRLALISITNLPKSTLFILDEPATALDQEHMEGFIRLLEMIKTKFKTVLIISHLDSLKDCVDMTIDIDKVGGYAKVKV
jgi:DNA repair exonuclease SbcCD ATPase subunit/predicted phosphodiesterase